jgi:hypothetical protein
MGGVGSFLQSLVELLWGWGTGVWGLGVRGDTPTTLLICLHHRDRTRASTLCFYFILFFSAFEHVKSLLIMSPNDIKNSSLKCDFHLINYE